MSIFDKISQEGHFVPTTELAGDVKSALLTTALGLIVAMAVHLFSFVLTQKMENIVGDMEKGCEEMINFCIVHDKNKQEKQEPPANDMRRERPATAERSARPSRQSDVENL